MAEELKKKSVQELKDKQLTIAMKRLLGRGNLPGKKTW